jgi:hypothetical protein
MTRIRAVLSVCGALVAGSAFGASPDPKDLAIPPEQLSKAREFVRKLGSDTYRDREDAQAELAKMGRVAKQVLNEAVLGDADPEIRLRASRLLPKANAADLAARIETFMADTEAKFEHDLPGLKTVRKGLNGVTKENVRALYVEILKSPYNIEIFVAMDKGNVEGGRAVGDRRNTLFADSQGQRFGPGGLRPSPPRQPTIVDLAALLFAEGQIPSENIPKSQTWQWMNSSYFLQQGVGYSTLTGTGQAHADAFKAIVRQWLVTRTDAQELTNLVHQLTQPSLKQFPEHVTLLRRTVTTEGVQGYAKGQALNMLIQTRGKDEIPFLKTLMNNDSMLQQVWFGKPNGQAEMHNCLMKDAALAFLISQTGGNIRDYGFETPNGVGFNPGQIGFGQYAFVSDEKRAAGFMKWGWKQLKDNIDGPLPKDGVKPDPQGTDPKPPTSTDPKPVPELPIKPGIRPLPAPVPLPAVPLPVAPAVLPAAPPVAAPAPAK